MSNSDNKKSFSLDNFFANLDFYGKLKVFKEVVKKAFLNYVLINVLLFALIFFMALFLGANFNIVFLLVFFICIVLSFYFYSHVILKVLSGDSSLINLAQIKSLVPHFFQFILNFITFIISLYFVLGILFLPFILYQQTHYGLLTNFINSVQMAIAMLCLGNFLFTFTSFPKLGYIKILSYIIKSFAKNKKDWLQAGLVVFIFVFIQNNIINILLPCVFASELTYDILLTCIEKNKNNALIYFFISVLNYLLIMSFIAVTFKKCESLNKLNKIKLI